MKIKSFRGSLADDEIRTILLSTNNGQTGYRVIKFELMASDPMDTAQESVVKLFSVPQTTATSAVDFSDSSLIAAGFQENNSGTEFFGGQVVIFDNAKYNQDIYITHKAASASTPVNYHIELEQVKLDLNEATVATLKDMRAGPDTNFGP